MKLLSKKEMDNQAKKLKLFPDNHHLEIIDILQEIDATEGLVNQIYRIKDKDTNKSLVAKQVLPFALAIKNQLGENHPMDPSRITLEARALTFMNTFWQGSAPIIFKVNKENGLIIMEDLTDYENLRFELPKGNQYPGLGVQIGSFLAGLRYYTSDLYLTSQEKAEFMDYFDNELHRNNMSNMIMGPDCPLFRDENFDSSVWPLREKAASDPQIKAEVERMRKYLIDSFECFCHMDLHIGNILVKDNNTKIIDSEFSGVGASFMDLGRIASSFLINYIAWLAQEEDPDGTRSKMLNYDLQVLFDLFESYRLTLKGLMPNNYEQVYNAVFKDSIRLCMLSTILRLQSGIALSHDIALIKSNKKFVESQKLSFKMLIDVFKNVDKYESIEDFIDYIDEVGQKVLKN